MGFHLLPQKFAPLGIETFLASEVVAEIARCLKPLNLFRQPVLR